MVVLVGIIILYSKQYSDKVGAIPVPVSIAIIGNRFWERLELLEFENYLFPQKSVSTVLDCFSAPWNTFSQYLQGFVRSVPVFQGSRIWTPDIA